MGKTVEITVEIDVAEGDLVEYHRALANLVEAINDQGVKVLDVGTIKNQGFHPGHEPGCRGIERDDTVPGTPTIRPYPQWEPNRIVSHNTDTSMYRNRDPLPRGTEEPNPARAITRNRSGITDPLSDLDSQERETLRHAETPDYPTYGGVPNC